MYVSTCCYSLTRFTGMHYGILNSLKRNTDCSKSLTHTNGKNLTKLPNQPTSWNRKFLEKLIVSWSRNFLLLWMLNVHHCVHKSQSLHHILNQYTLYLVFLSSQWILREKDRKVWTGLIWLRKGTSGGLL